MISVVIPTYNNTKQLVENLKKNTLFLKDNEIIVINDYPEKRIATDLIQFPKIKLIENDHNLGFSGAVHKAITLSSNRYVMLLNDDVQLNDTSYQKTLTVFKSDQNLFAISFAQKEKDATMVGKNMFYWKDGFFHHGKADDFLLGINGWAEGGSCILDKEKYHKIGGFDPLFAPFYWEDVDLSYRAWKQGYTILFDPTIIVTHYHQSTIGKQFDKNKVDEIAYRNQFIFIWKNISDIRLIISHVLKIIVSFPIMCLKNTQYIKGFYQGLQKIPNILQKKYKGVLSDKEVLKKFLPHA